MRIVLIGTRKKRPTHERKCIGKISADGKEEYNEYYLNRGKIRSLEKKAAGPARPLTDAASHGTLSHRYKLVGIFV